MDAAQDRARELTGSGPTFSEHDWDAVINAIGKVLEEPVKKKNNRGRKPGKPSYALRKYPYHDLEVGQSCRLPNSAGMNARQAAHMYGNRVGRTFETRAKSNGLWIKRVA